MSIRYPLKKGVSIDVVPLSEAGSQVIRHFAIDDMIGSGATSYCYKARSQKGTRGVLKEFYPDSIAGLQRNSQNHQLLCSDAGRQEPEVFRAEMAAFLNAYSSLLEITQKTDEDAANVAACIPAYELYQGCSRDGSPVGTAYVWIPVPAYKSFEQVCREVHEKPETMPQHNLVLLLKSLCELAAAVLELHAVGLIHRDIKPQNFGFLTRDRKPLEQSLAFFDADSICSFSDHKERELVYTPGYFEPGILTPDARATVQDFYAIGATAFHALITGRPPEMDVSNPEACKAYLTEAVYAAPLLNACRLYLPPKFKHRLIEFLLKCFQLHEDSFTSCKHIQEALEDLRDSVMPLKRPSNGKWEWREAEKHLDRHHDANARLAIQYHLYSHPLYEHSKEENINVLLLGFGQYGQTFMDACLQAGQLLNQRLNVTVFSDDALDSTVYLADRPALPGFFNVSVDGSPRTEDPEKPSYGSITFHKQTLTFTRGGAPQVDDCLRNLREDPHYIFIALGDDALNYSAARQCRGIFSGGDKIIHFVCEDEESLNGAPQFSPVFVNRSVKRSKDYQELERMAFNVHLVWEKALNFDLDAVRGKFLEPYNHDSCMSSVLSIKGKLHSFGIELGEMSPIQAAAAFTARVAEDPQVRQKVIWLEHRRWVAEKICQGYTALTDMQECARLGDHRDKARRRHTCLVFSSPEDTLKENFYNKNGTINPKRWDETGYLDGQDGSDGPDPLDKMSVALHRAYLARAKADEGERWNQICGVFSLIEQKVASRPDARQAWEEYRTCIQDVRSRYAKRVHQLKALRDAFLKYFDESNPDTAFINSQLEALDAAFHPIIKSMEYTNFKDEDIKMVDQIPFILTYSMVDGLIIPYLMGDNSRLFQNVAAALVINPAELLYLYHVESIAEFKELCESFSFLTHFIRRKNLRAKVSFHLTYPHALVGQLKTTPEGLAADLTRQLTEAGAGLIASSAICGTDDRETAVAHFRSIISHKPYHRFALECNDGVLSCMMQGARIHHKRRHYRFHAERMAFTEPDSCRTFSYIVKKPCLSAADIISIKKSGVDSFDYPEFRLKYREIWEKSREGYGYPWKNLCSLLRKHIEQQSLIVKFSLNSLADSQLPYNFQIPRECYPAVNKILEAMKAARMIKAESCLTLSTTQTYQVTIWDRTNSRALFNRLFSDISLLMSERDVLISADKFNLKIFHNTLTVRELSLEDLNDKQARQIPALLDYLTQNGYLQCYSISAEGKHNFSFATHGVKELLTIEGKALEIYVYHKLKNADFDDVVSSFEILWEGTSVRSEFDCLVTRGFCSLFIECKSRPELEQGFYFKLLSLANHFGVNPKAILIADTQENCYQTDANSMQRTRGMLLDVITIWKPEEIRNIDKTLLKLLGAPS